MIELWSEIKQWDILISIQFILRLLQYWFSYCIFTGMGSACNGTAQFWKISWKEHSRSQRYFRTVSHMYLVCNSDTVYNLVFAKIVLIDYVQPKRLLSYPLRWSHICACNIYDKKTYGCWGRRYVVTRQDGENRTGAWCRTWEACRPTKPDSTLHSSVSHPPFPSGPSINYTSSPIMVYILGTFCNWMCFCRIKMVLLQFRRSCAVYWSAIRVCNITSGIIICQPLSCAVLPHCAHMMTWKSNFFSRPIPVSLHVAQMWCAN